MGLKKGVDYVYVNGCQNICATVYKYIYIYNIFFVDTGMLDSAMGIYSSLPKFKLRRTAIYETGTTWARLIECPLKHPAKQLSSQAAAR